ncbi:MAG: hypothetical protein ACT4QG_23100 [Sporichthyaceae bacterium]
MARNDLELGADWSAKEDGRPSASVERKSIISDDYARLREDERDSKVGLDASGHQALAEHRERMRQGAVMS